MHKRQFWNIVLVIALVGCIGCAGFTGWYYWQRYSHEKNYQEMRDEVVEGASGANATGIESTASGASEAEAPAANATGIESAASGASEAESTAASGASEAESTAANETESTANGASEAADETTEATPDQHPSYTLEEIENAEFTGVIDAPAPKIPTEVLTELEDQPIDFTKLNEINPELYAWIRIPDTNIDYPVAQHDGEDQTFYLHRDMYGEPQFAGCIYSEKPNKKDFSDPVTVLYGHNMINGAMFQNLHLFREREFFDNHKYVYVYTKQGSLVYEIYAAYTYDDRHILKSFDFSKEKDLKKYINESLHPRQMDAMVREGVDVTVDDHVLTLSTCLADQPGSRLLVQAVLTYEKDGE